MSNRSTTAQSRALGQTGINLLRVVIGSYFIGLSLALVKGLDYAALFLPILPLKTADMLGSMLLFILATAYMSGAYLRLTSLALVLFVLCSSIVQNFTVFEFGSISAFWRDLALCCAVMLSYSTLNRHDLSRARIHRKTKSVRKVTSDTAVAPRRVTTRLENEEAPKRLTEQAAEHRRLVAGTVSLERFETTCKSLMAATAPDDDEPEITNIFAEI